MSAPPVPSSAQSGRLLSVRHSLLAVLGLCFVSVLVAIDQTVVGTALPTIVAELQGFELYAWVASGYLLTAVVTVPVFGRLGDYYGRKPFVVASILVFSLASVISSLSQSMMQLVLARALQGVGGGMLLGTVFACVPDLFPDARVRLRWQVLLSAAYGIASGIGPTLGGFLTQVAGWRSVFYVNLPIGFVGLFMIWRYLPHIRQVATSRVTLDWQGALLIAVGLTCLQLFVELLPRRGVSLTVILLGLCALLCLGGLLLWEKRCAQPLLPMSMLRDRSLATLFVLSLLAGALMFVLLFYVPLLFQGGFGMTPQEVGLAITPLVVFITVGSIINGRVVMRLPRPNDMLYLGFGLLTLCTIGLVFTRHSTSGGLLALIMTLGGLGFGFVMPNLTVFAQQVAGRTLLGISTAMLQSTRMIGGMLGMALIGTVVSHYYAGQVHKMVAGLEDTGWKALLADPQVLVNRQTQTVFAERLRAVALESQPLLEQAREALVGAVHAGLLVSLMFALLATAWVMRLPPTDLSASPGRSA